MTENVAFAVLGPLGLIVFLEFLRFLGGYLHAKNIEVTIKKDEFKIRIHNDCQN